jgi:hypothetical protein
LTLDLTVLGTLVERFGLPLALLIALIWSGWKRMWVFGWYPELLEKQNAQLQAEVHELQTAARENAAALSQLLALAERGDDARGR